MRRTVAWLAAALALTAGVARGEEGADAGDGRARELFLSGAAAFEAGEYERALEDFEASYALSPVTSVLYNIAMCERALFRYGDSMDSFERYLEAAGDRLSAERRAEVLGLLDDMEARVATVELRLDPEEAEVTLDGAPLAAARRGRLRLLPGLHVVEATSEGYEPVRREVEVDGGQVEVLALVLEPEGEGGPGDVTPPGGPSGPGPGGDDGLVRQWWFWTAIAGAAVLVGAGIGLGVAFGAPQGVGQGDWQVELP